MKPAPPAESLIAPAFGNGARIPQDFASQEKFQGFHGRYPVNGCLFREPFPLEIKAPKHRIRGFALNAGWIGEFTRRVDQDFPKPPGEA
jgi:hypothetical protein